eukprot:COSAG01_NODE_38022_length_495_cov_1.297980_1_plen_67_part_01
MVTLRGRTSSLYHIVQEAVTSSPRPHIVQEAVNSDVAIVTVLGTAKHFDRDRELVSAWLCYSIQYSI